jgi:LacI family transcriptional regulator
MARESGYQRALFDEKQCRPDVYYADFKEDKAKAIVADLADILRIAAKPAIFAASDIMAIGVMNGLKEIQLLDKVSIVGFDDITLASYVTPKLSTVRQNMYKMSQLATKYLINRIENDKVIHRIVDYELVERESARLFE